MCLHVYTIFEHASRFETQEKSRVFVGYVRGQRKAMKAIAWRRQFVYRHLALDGTYGAYETFKTYCNV